MTDNELKRLSRADLLEMLVERNKEIDSLNNLVNKLQRQIEIYDEKLKNRAIAIYKAGSIAEAALDINGVFESAQAAADQYLENIKAMHEREKKICEEKIEQTQALCQRMINSAEKESRAIIAKAKTGDE